MSVDLWFLVGLATVLIVWLQRRHAIRASDAATWDCPDGAALRARSKAIDQESRRQHILQTWGEPWSWWFLGACLAFAGLCLGAGLWQWHTPDAPVLLLGGLVFGLASTFKAWAQKQAAQGRLP